MFKLAFLLLGIFLTMVTPAFALAPSPPSIFIQVSPAYQDVAAGASATFKIDVVPQGTWDLGKVTFNITGLPAGVTATLGSNPATVQSGGASLALIVKADANATGSFIIKISAQGVASTGEKSTSDVSATLNIRSQNVSTTTLTHTTTASTTITTTTTQTAIKTATVLTTSTVATTLTSLKTETLTRTNTEKTTETYTSIQSSTQTITTVFITTSTTTSSILVGVQDGSNLWIYSTLGIGIALAGAFVALAVSRRK